MFIHHTNMTREQHIQHNKLFITYFGLIYLYTLIKYLVILIELSIFTLNKKAASCFFPHIKTPKGNLMLRLISGGTKRHVSSTRVRK